MPGATSYVLYMKMLPGPPDGSVRVSTADVRLADVHSPFSTADLNLCDMGYYLALASVGEGGEGAMMDRPIYLSVAPKDCTYSDAAPEVLESYEAWERSKPTDLARIEADYGRPFEQFGEPDYARFLDEHDLVSEQGLRAWSIATGIPVVGVSFGSNFAYYNAHLAVEPGARELPYSQYSTFSSTWDASREEVHLVDGDGRARPTMPVPAGTITSLTQSGEITFNKGFVEDHVTYAALARYLVPLDAVAERPAIAAALRALPLVLVKALRGKALFLSLRPGRSYAISMPVSNDVYPLFAGLMPGLILEANSEEQTPETLVHEFCHVIDGTVISRSYGTVYYMRQFPEFQKLLAERDAIFSERPADMSHGFISEYSKANEAEDFAEHCWAIVRDRSAFEQLAAAEETAGHTLLRRKFNFMAKMLETAPSSQLLNQQLVDALNGR